MISLSIFEKYACYRSPHYSQGEKYIFGLIDIDYMILCLQS